MILSKSNLKSIAITLIDKAIPVLNNLHITKDGATIVCNGKVTLAVSPVNSEIKKNVPLKEVGKIPDEGLTINSETIREVIKAIPKDTLFNGLLEYTELDNGKFLVNDGKRKKSIEGKVYERKYVDYKQIFKMAGDVSGAKIVVNRKRLYQLLKVIDDICPDSSGESPIFIEFTKANDIMLRSVNYKTGQNILATMATYKQVEGKWPMYTRWEQILIGKLKKVFKKRRGY